MVDRDLPDAPIDVVLSDKRGGAFLATRHLIALGHRRIGCIGGPSSLLMSGQRLQGYRDALVEADLPVDEGLSPGDYHRSRAGRRPAVSWRCRRPRPPSSPPTTSWRSGSWRGGRARAARAADLAVVGFDDIELASYTTPPLTTVSQSASEVGRAAVELLLERLADPGRPPVRRTFETRLVVRASCGNHS